MIVSMSSVHPTLIVAFKFRNSGNLKRSFQTHLIVSKSTNISRRLKPSNVNFSFISLQSPGRYRCLRLSNFHNTFGIEISPRLTRISRICKNCKLPIDDGNFLPPLQSLKLKYFKWISFPIPSGIPFSPNLNPSKSKTLSNLNSLRLGKSIPNPK
ncbi:hypothetical protein LguiB_026376 [Lonicera macranthoides]